MTITCRTCHADNVEEVRHRIESGVKMLGDVAGLDVLDLLHDVQLLACLALDAEEPPAVADTG